MSITLPAAWAKAKSVPTSTVTIKGQGGDVVATITVTGTAHVITHWPYSYSNTQT